MNQRAVKPFSRFCGSDKRKANTKVFAGGANHIAMAAAIPMQQRDDIRHPVFDDIVPISRDCTA